MMPLSYGDENVELHAVVAWRHLPWVVQFVTFATPKGWKPHVKLPNISEQKKVNRTKQQLVENEYR